MHVVTSKPYGIFSYMYVMLKAPLNGRTGSRSQAFLPVDLDILLPRSS